jgi:hypothetical protein
LCMLEGETMKARWWSASVGEEAKADPFLADQILNEIARPPMSACTDARRSRLTIWALPWISRARPARNEAPQKRKAGICAGSSFFSR